MAGPYNRATAAMPPATEAYKLLQQYTEQACRMGYTSFAAGLKGDALWISLDRVVQGNALNISLNELYTIHAYPELMLIYAPNGVYTTIPDHDTMRSVMANTRPDGLPFGYWHGVDIRTMVS